MSGRQRVNPLRAAGPVRRLRPEQVADLAGVLPGVVPLPRPVQVRVRRRGQGRALPSREDVLLPPLTPPHTLSREDVDVRQEFAFTPAQTSSCEDRCLGLPPSDIEPDSTGATVGRESESTSPPHKTVRIGSGGFIKVVKHGRGCGKFLFRHPSDTCAWGRGERRASTDGNRNASCTSLYDSSSSRPCCARSSRCSRSTRWVGWGPENV